MEVFLVHLIHAALWLFLIIFIFAVVGVYATIRWVVNMVTRGEQAVEAGVHNVTDRFQR